MMKKFQLGGIAALTLLGSFATSQAQTATTAPVGYVTLASDTNPIPANTDVRLSVPMEASVDFTGVAASASSNILTVANASFTENEFAPATGGYYVRLKTGDSAGLTAEITGNTTDALTLALEAGDDLTNIDDTTQIEIVKYFTLSTFFPDTLPVGTQVQFFENKSGINNAPTTFLVWTGSFWLQSGVGQVDAVLYPGENFVLRNNSASPITDIVVTGNVPTVSHRVKLTSIDSDRQDFAVGYLSPVEEKIGDSGLGFSVGDQLLAYDNSATGQNKAPSTILVYTGSYWLQSGVGNVNDTFHLQPGQGYTYRRAANNAGTVEWANTQTYNQ
jgi:uncharacterized protein (TIGR02597 family)